MLQLHPQLAVRKYLKIVLLLLSLLVANSSSSRSYSSVSHSVSWSKILEIFSMKIFKGSFQPYILLLQFLSILYTRQDKYTGDLLNSPLHSSDGDGLPPALRRRWQQQNRKTINKLFARTLVLEKNALFLRKRNCPCNLADKIPSLPGTGCIVFCSNLSLSSSQQRRGQERTRSLFSFLLYFSSHCLYSISHKVPPWLGFLKHQIQLIYFVFVWITVLCNAMMRDVNLSDKVSFQFPKLSALSMSHPPIISEKGSSVLAAVLVLTWVRAGSKKR